jgi:hypothetical protein
MTVGFTQTKDDVNNRAGQLAVGLRDTLAECVQFKAWLDDAATTDAFLSGLGFSSGEITLLRASFTDLAKLSDISHAAATQSPANDFWFNARHLTGVV